MCYKFIAASYLVTIYKILMIFIIDHISRFNKYNSKTQET